MYQLLPVGLPQAPRRGAGLERRLGPPDGLAEADKFNSQYNDHNHDNDDNNVNNDNDNNNNGNTDYNTDMI